MVNLSLYAETRIHVITLKAVTQAVNITQLSLLSTDIIRESGSVLQSRTVWGKKLLCKHLSLHWGSGMLVSDDFYNA